MTGFDYTVIAIIVLSALLGWWRGLVYEVLSLLGWVAAFIVARSFSGDAAAYMPDALGMEAARIAAAFVVLFIVTLIGCGVVTWLLAKLVKWVGLGWLDGMLGTLFGALRGMVLVLALVVMAGLTGLPQRSFWRDATLSKPLEGMALATQAWLPDSVAQRMHY